MYVYTAVLYLQFTIYVTYDVISHVTYVLYFYISTLQSKGPGVA